MSDDLLHNDTADDLIAAANASTLQAHAIASQGSGFDGAVNRALENALDRRMELAELWGCELSDLPDRIDAHYGISRSELADAAEVE